MVQMMDPDWRSCGTCKVTKQAEICPSMIEQFILFSFCFIALFASLCSIDIIFFSTASSLRMRNQTSLRLMVKMVVHFICVKLLCHEKSRSVKGLGCNALSTTKQMQIVTLFETHSLKLIFFCTTTFSFILSSFFSSLFSSILSPLLQVEIFLLFVSLYRQLITFQLFHYFFRIVSVYKICSFISSRSISE